MQNLPHLTQRLFNVPLALSPGKVEIIMAALADRFGLANLFKTNGECVPLSSIDIGTQTFEQRAYSVIEGVAIIPIQGTLVQKSGFLQPYSGMTGYDGIRACFSMALDDPDVKAIMLDIDSPGGEVSGCFDLVDSIYSARGIKPIWAVLSEMAASAAYAIASAADKITVPRTGVTGSVGVICAHVDMSKALSQEGMTVTLITYGARKGEGNEFTKLEGDALAHIQKDIDMMGELFVQTVSRNRNMSSAKVKATEAGTFRGLEGVQIGFADAVMAPDEAFSALVSDLKA